MDWVKSQAGIKTAGRNSNNLRYEDDITLMAESESEVAQSCPTLCNPVDCSLPGSAILRIFQAGVLEWVPRLQARLAHYAAHKAE